MSVTATHPEYMKHIETWKLIDKVLSGDVSKFIKPVDPENAERNKRYADDAVFTNFTEKTRNGLIGTVYRKPIKTMEWPTELEYIENDVTGTGIPIQKLTKQTSGEVLAKGKAGILADFPRVEGKLNAQKTKELGVKARLVTYKPQQITNWRCGNVDGSYKLTLVVLSEEKEVVSEHSKFLSEVKTIYRVLELIEGVYTVSLIDKENNLIDSWVPRDYNGKTLDTIPFIMVGAEDNDYDTDTAPLETLARLNIAHYRNSADHEEHVHQASQSTLFMTSTLSHKQLKQIYPKGIRMGVAAANHLGSTGNAWLLQTNPNDLADTSMSRKEQQAIMLGARIIVSPGTNETATAAMLKHSGEHSVLMNVMDNVESAYKLMIHYLSRFMMPTPLEVGDIGYEINNQYFDPLVNPQEIIADLQLYNNGVIGLSDLREELRQLGKLREDRTDEDIDEEIINTNPIPTNDPVDDDEEDVEDEDDNN